MGSIGFKLSSECNMAEQKTTGQLKIRSLQQWFILEIVVLSRRYTMNIKHFENEREGERASYILQDWPEPG